jgi:redox-sensitive bicupin YhaK (pirin superfamily)
MSLFASDFSGASAIRLPTVRDAERRTHSTRVLPAVHQRMIGPFALLEQFGPTLFEAGHGFDMQPHPHRGLAAVTYLIDGELVHRDSLGSVQTTRPGDVNWLTAGSGVVHSERTSPEARISGSDFLGIQAWVALPARFEEIDADFAHHPAQDVPRTYADGVEFTLIAGQSEGLAAPVKILSDLILAEIVLTSGARYQVRPDHIERAVYVIAGEVEIVGQAGMFAEGDLILLKPGAEVILKAPAFHAARLMLVGGEPFAEPRYVDWNFVSSSPDRIVQAKADWRERRFPEIPGEDDATPHTSNHERYEAAP